MILPCDLKSVDMVAEYMREKPAVIPTDTLYGLCVSIEGDVESVYTLKKRSRDKPIPIGVADLEIMRKIAYLNANAEKLVRKYMPGPLTIVLKNRGVRFLGDTVGVRIPAHWVPLTIMRKIGPITLTSANISGEKPPRAVEDTLGIDVEYRIDCGELSGVPSTVVDLTKGVKLIREGAIPFRDILRTLEE